MIRDTSLAVYEIETLFRRSFAYFWMTMAQVRNANSTRKVERNPSAPKCDPRTLGFCDNVFGKAAYSLADMTLPELDGRCGRHRARQHGLRNHRCARRARRSAEQLAAK
jgi:hypothetical protein